MVGPPRRRPDARPTPGRSPAPYAGPVSTVPPLLVITNADAGTADDDALEAALGVLRPATEVEVRATSSPDELDDALAHVGDRWVVVVGGDGSIHAVIDALHRRRSLADAVVALIPLGTGNDFARTLGIPLDPAEAAQVVLDGQVRPVDAIVDDEEGVTVNSVHIGAGAEAGERGAKWKERLGSVGVGKLNLGKLGYPIGAAQTALNPPHLRVSVEVDGRRVARPRDRVLMVALGNGQSVGGGTELTPDADPHDGLIDVIVASPAGVLDRVALAMRLPFGTHDEHATVESLRGRTVRITGRPFSCNSDGEIEGPVQSRTWRIEPAAYSMVLPARHESEPDGAGN